MAACLWNCNINDDEGGNKHNNENEKRLPREMMDLLVTFRMDELVYAEKHTPIYSQ
jgi:hypothetical protein